MVFISCTSQTRIKQHQNAIVFVHAHDRRNIQPVTCSSGRPRGVGQKDIYAIKINISACRRWAPRSSSYSCRFTCWQELVNTNSQQRKINVRLSTSEIIFPRYLFLITWVNRFHHNLLFERRKGG